MGKKLGNFRQAVEGLVDTSDYAQVALAILALDSYEGRDKVYPFVTKGEVEVVEWKETDLKLATDCVHKIMRHQMDKEKLNSGSAGNHSFTTVFVVDGAEGAVDPWDNHPLNPDRTEGTNNDYNS